MHNKKDCILGIDTSNYKTSAAITDAEGNIICDLRQLLRVKEGERGLRQSDALFQHVENLPGLIEEAFNKVSGSRICAVACSSKPRPVEGSYMPVFKGGTAMGRSVAASLGVPYMEFSHQEGHIEAIRHRTPMEHKESFLCYHLSGGTCELLKVEGDNITIIGGSKDISFGQVIDRVGVKLGMAFPAGEFMDRQALEAEASTKLLKKISNDGLYFNLSGIETQAIRSCEKILPEEEPALIREVMDRLAALLCKVTEEASRETGIKDVIFTGGVASSKYISAIIKGRFENTDICCEFGQQEFSQDNAVGIALLGGKKVWQLNR